ncbi:MAG: glycosyltransferase family 39 protein, partial [Verrucomicrobiota bacterium]|nr:glycosyltransferase family 39 protein [Verrucomicrobiota bacterium]
MTDDRRSKTSWRIALAFSAITLLIHLLTNSRYGYFRDELYFIACARHLAFGYVDLAPLSVLLLRVETICFGDSLFALRLFPAIAGALTVALTAALAREMGGRTWAITLACAAATGAIVCLALGNFYSLNVFEPLFWMGCVYLLLRIINGASPRLWLGFGVVAGLGVENKHSFVFFGVGLTAALFFTPLRRQLRMPWIWLGGLIAVLLALPNILWQMQHGWPTHELLNNIAHSNKNVVLTPLQFVLQQILIMNPATFPLWFGGLIWLFASRAGRRYYLLGIAYLITLA